MESKEIFYNDDVEKIVNDPDRQKSIKDFYNKQHTKKHRKMLMDACLCAAVAMAFGLFGCVDWVTPYIALPICVIGTMYSTFQFGRWFENGKCRGWY